MSCSYQSLLRGVAIAPVFAAMAVAACAQDVRAFDVPAGPLDAALVQYARQAGRQVFYTNEQVAGRRTAGVQGRMAVGAALEQLLSGSGLTWTESRPGVLTLRTAGQTADVDAVEDVIVTGTLIRGPGETPSPITVIRRDAIDRDGRANVADAVAALPQNYAGSGTPVGLLAYSDPIRTNSGLATGVNLRGLGTDATLVLVNGRRMGGTGSKGDFADVSAIPTAAVDRVDVLLDGASALYGADAVGGVVNIILKQDFSGQETRVRASAARGGAEDITVAHTLGFEWRSGGALLSYEHQDQNGLSASDRDYSATGDLRPFGGTDRRVIYAAPGNIVGYSAAQGAYVSLFAIRPGADGVADSESEFAADQTNLSNRQQGINLLPEQESDRLYAFVRQSLTPGFELTADARYTEREFRYPMTPTITIARVTDANPFFYSPSGATSHQIAYSFAEDLGNPIVSGHSESVGLTLGANIDLPGRWRLETYGAYAREENESGQDRILNTVFLAEALGNTADSPLTPYSAPRDGYLNLFGNGSANSAAVLDFIGSGYIRTGYQGETKSLNLLAQGPVVRLAGGEVRIAVGAQYRTEGLRNWGEQFYQTAEPRVSGGLDYERSLWAAFVEARVPLVGPDNARPGLRSLELSLAARIEDYEDVGDTTNPKIGVVWSPAEGLKMRASWGTSFRAPALTELNEAYQISAVDVFDGTIGRYALIELGGNPGLRPETAESLTVGFDLSPSVIPGFAASLTLFDTRFKDQIGRPGVENYASALIDPSLAPFVTRIAAGSASDLALVHALTTHPEYQFPGLLPDEAFSAIIDGRWVNTAETHVRGIDWSSSFAFDVGANALTLETSASYLIDYEQALTPAAPFRSLVSTINYPVDFRGTVAGLWRRGDWLARVAFNHVDAYRDPLGQTIDAWDTIDANLHWTPIFQAWASGLRVSLNVLNLLDEDPPFYDAITGIGFDPGQASPLGRTVSLQLTKRW